MFNSPPLSDFLTLSTEEKARRFDAMVRATFSHVDGRDLLDELHPRKELDIARRADGGVTWFEGDWLSGLRDERNGGNRWWLADAPQPSALAADVAAAERQFGREAA